MGRRDGGGKKRQPHDQTSGFDVSIESMKKKMIKKEHRPEKEREGEKGKEGEIQAGGEERRAHTPCLGNALDFQKFFFLSFRGAFLGAGKQRKYATGEGLRSQQVSVLVCM